jgi:hypothetical protein
MAVLVAVVLTINAVFMLGYPRAWFRLPRWLGLVGSLREDKYASGIGAIEIQFTGAVILALIGWVAYHVVTR